MDSTTLAIILDQMDKVEDQFNNFEVGYAFQHLRNRLMAMDADLPEAEQFDDTTASEDLLAITEDL